MSAPVPSDPAMLRIIASYLRSLERRCSRTLMCADTLDRVADSVEIAQGHHDAIRRELDALAVTAGGEARVQEIAQAVLRGLPAWLTTPHGGRS